MSFGASSALRFEDQRGGVRNPIVFWEKQAAESKKTHKKFKTKGREQGFPLRSKAPPPPEEEAPVQRRRRPVTNPNNKKEGQAPVAKQKSSAQRRIKKETPKTAGTITLTQKEFDTILETIGQLAVEAEEVKHGNTSDEKQRKGSEKQAPLDEHSRRQVVESQDLAVAQDLPPETNRSGRPSINNVPGPQPSGEAATVVVEPSTIPGLDLSPRPQVGQDRAAEPSTDANKQNIADEPQLSVRKSVLGIPTAHLTKAEKKRLEWERQRAESAKNEAWSPWGRPGAGAPRRDTHGNVVAGYSDKQDTDTSPKQQEQHPAPDNIPTRRPPHHPPPSQTNKPTVSSQRPQPISGPGTTTKDPPPPAAIRSSFAIGSAAPNEDRFTSAKERQRQEWLQELEKQREEQRQRKLSEKELAKEPYPPEATGRPPDNTPAIRPPHQPPPSQTNKPTVSTTSPSQRPPTINGPGTTAKEPPQPAAIRSSFTMGNAAPNENRFTSAKERQRQEWLDELEKQREEQRQRKLSEKEAKRTEDVHDTWADRFSIVKPSAVPEQQATITPRPTQPPEPPQSEHWAQNNRVNSAPATQPAPQQPTTQQVSPTSYLRGQNAPIDPLTLREFEEKRRKQHEHQEYIKAQIEEKERLRREEKERQRREEQEEEDRLKRERNQLDNQLEQEKQRQKDKENLERQRLDALKQAMEQAQEVAEREKHEKRVRKLQNAGHDVTQLHANYQAKMTPRDDPNMVEPSYVPGLFPTPRDVVKVVPSHVPGLDPSPRDGAEIQDSVYQASHAGHTSTTPHREFGIQTDPDLDMKVVSRESTGIEYSGPIIEKKKKVRVQSAPTEEIAPDFRTKSVHSEVIEKPKKKRPLKISERPKWGQTNKPRKIKTQSERDPFFEERIHEKEFKRAQRQEKLLRMAEKHRPKVSETTTAASRARSRSRERRESVGGTRAESRSRSPPVDRLQGPSPQHRSRKHSQCHSPAHDKLPSRMDSTPDRAAYRSDSPPIPAIKHRNTPKEYNVDAYNYDNHRDVHSRMSGGAHNKYQDNGPVHPPVPTGDFVPFIRSSNVLDPAHAESPLPISREPTIMDRARKAYLQEHNPAKFGFTMDNYQDDEKRDVGKQIPQVTYRTQKDPILNPSLVTDHPSGRQNQILAQLSDLRRGLMQKQRELEIGLPGMEAALAAE